MAAAFVEAVVSGYFAQKQDDIDREAIEEFLASSDAFQLIAIDQKNNVKFTTVDAIPDGAAAIIFKKPKGVKIDQANMAGKLSFHTFAMVDGPLTYLSSNRETSRRLAKQMTKKLGSLGSSIIDNFDAIESETELAAAHAFLAEMVASQRSHSDRDLILKYVDAFYAEFADKAIQQQTGEQSMSQLIDTLDKLVAMIDKSGAAADADQTRQIVAIWRNLDALKRVVDSIRILCKIQLVVPPVTDRTNIAQATDAEIRKLLKEYGKRCAQALSRDIASSSSPSRVLSLCTQHAPLFEHHVELDDKETIVAMLEANLKQEATSSTTTEPFNSSKLVKEMMATQWREKMARDTAVVAQSLDSDGLLRRATKANLEEQDKRKKLNEQWLTATEDEVADLIAQIGSNREVFTFDRNGQLTMGFSSRWEVILREVKQIGALNLKVSSTVESHCKKAAKFYRAGMSLQQVQHFHNHIAKEIIPSAKTMLLKEAVAFEAQLKNIASKSTTMVWENPDELERFAASLMKSAEVFKTKNERIKREHARLEELVLKMLETDLVRRMDKWKELVSAIRERVHVIVEAFGSEDSHPWRIHWDHQIYKVLELHYAAGLSSLIDRLPDIGIDLIVRDDQVSFRPELEHARARFYKEVKRFSQIPYHFRGVSDEKELFVDIGYDNAHLLVPTIERGEEIFRQLDAFRVEYNSWVYPAQVDTGAIFAALDDQLDYENALRTIKLKGKELERLPNERRVGCVTVAIQPFKRGVETLIQKCYTGICGAMNSRVEHARGEIVEFCQQSSLAFNQRATTIDDITKQQMKHANIKTEMDSEMKQKMVKVEGLAKLHRQTTGNEIDLSSLQSKWEDMTVLLASYDQVAKEQMEQLKASTKERANAARAKVDKFKSKWTQGKPADERGLMSRPKEMKQFSEFVAEKHAEMLELADELAEVDQQLSVFNLEPLDQIMDQFNELKVDIRVNFANWALMSEFESTFGVFLNEEWLLAKSRLPEFVDKMTAWSDERLKTENQHSAMQARLREKIEKYKEGVLCLKWCRGDNFTTEHWLDLFRLIQLPRGTSIDQVTLLMLLEVVDHIQLEIEQIKQINERAHAEISIRESLRELEVWSGSAEFTLAEGVTTPGTKINLVKDWRDTLAELGDQQRLVATLKESPAAASFGEVLSSWETKLVTCDAVLNVFCELQRRWLYLEPVFSRGVFPTEKARFAAIDNDIQGVLREAARVKLVTTFSTRSGLLHKLEQLLQKLQASQKALSTFLEDKRNAFDRFFFLGDDDLLEILGRPEAVTTHLRKLFAGVAGLDIIDNCVVAARSLEGECLKLEQRVQIQNAPEIWLGELAAVLKSTMRSILGQTKGTKELERTPAQIVCLVQQLDFTKYCERAITKNALGEMLKKVDGEIDELTSRKATMSNLGKVKITSLILDAVHHKDVVNQLISVTCSSLEDWQWLKQLRFYKKTDGINAKIVDAKIEYSWEYDGVPSRLVHTALTDKCFLVLSQALKNGLGGNPYGPAGTGKTETIKELGSLVGRHVLVFNCDEGLDVQSMSKIFMGLCRSGAWGCFDEFNRLTENVLSAISMDIQTIQYHLMSKQTKVMLQGTDNVLSPYAAIFVTLNPAGKGYGGRRKLPDNLKSLFRPVAMSRPDNNVIAKVMLFAEGFTNDTLGRRLVKLYDLCKQLLSEQQHYDWGLRALKTVLRTAGKMLQNEARQLDANGELEIAVRAIVINTMSKLIYSDILLFRDLLKRIFPECPEKTVDDASIDSELETAARELKLYMYPNLKRKCSELLEQLKQRIGCVICGPPASGKSSLWRVLAKAQKNGIVVHYMNPKAGTREQLLGSLDVDTREWKDGTLTAAARRVNRELSAHHWIVCDGEIDPDWIEALNSVLDDNHLLTLPNGERIQFGTNVNFIFETSDLKHASPATISRMGVIFLSPEEVDHAQIAFNEIKQLATNAELADEAINWTQSVLLKGINWLDKHAELSLVSRSGLTRLLDAVRHQNWDGEQLLSREEFIINAYRSMTCGLSTNGAIRLAEKVFDQIGLAPSTCVRVVDGTVVPIEAQTPLTGIVPTTSLLTQAEAVMLWMNSSSCSGIALLGGDGTGKSTLVQHCAKSLYSVNLIEFNCSLSAKSSDLLDLIQLHTIQGQSQFGRVLRPKGFDSLMLHVKGINIPRLDKWGTNQLGAFITQLLTRHGFYNDDNEWISLEKVKIIVSMNPNKGKMEQRLATALQVQVIDDLAEADLVQISTAIWRHAMGENTHDLAESAARCLIALQNEFPLSRSNLYNFNLQHLSDWAANVATYQCNDKWHSWYFEAERLFRDRLISDQDRGRFDAIFGEFNRSPSDRTFFPTVTPSTIKVDLYAPEQLNTLLEGTAKSFGREVADLPPGGLVLNDELQMNVVKVTNQLASTGALMLIGSAGSGRRTAVQLAAHYLGHDVHQPPITNISDKTVKAFFRGVTGAAGVDDKHVCLMAEQHHLESTPLILELINSLLSQGTLHGLWSSDELEQLKPIATSMGLTPPQLFAARCIANIHIVTIIQRGSELEKTCFQQCPALAKRAKFVNIANWSDETLTEVAKVQLVGPMANMAAHCARMYHDHGWNMSQFHFLLDSLRAIHASKTNEIMARGSKLEQGLSKLSEASETVSSLEEKVKEQGKELAEKRADADAALEAIQRAMSGAETQKGEMEVKQKNAAAEKEIIQRKKEQIQAELDEVQPVIDQAKQSVGNIKPKALNEIRALRAPPETIRDILEGVLKLMGNQDTSWTSMKSFLGKRGIRDEIAQFDARHISTESRNQVEQLLQARANSFTDAAAKRASIAAQPLATWVRANVQYASVLERIAPLEAEEARLMTNLKAAELEVRTLGSGITTVEEKVAKLKVEFEERTGEAAKVAAKMEETESVLKRAGKLIGDLGGEKKRWMKTSGEIKEQATNVPISSLLAAGYIVFLASKPESERRTKFDQWCQQFGVRISFLDFIVTEMDRLEYHRHGMPNDTLSLENAATMLQFIRPGFILDESGRSQQFIKCYMKDIQSIPADADHLQSSLELAIRFGKVVFIENVLSVSPYLSEVLKNQVLTVGSRPSIKLGSNTLDIHPDFKLLLGSKTISPRDIELTTGMASTVIFSMTQAGLEHQFLSMAITSENPKLGELMASSVKKEEELRMKVIRLEDELLSLLAKSEGDILKNDKLIDSLKQSKKSTKEAKKTLDEIKTTKLKLEEERNVYLPLAQAGANAVFKLGDLGTIDHMYTTGLQCVNVLFSFVLAEFKSADVNILRSEFVKKTIQFVMQMSKAADVTPNVLYVLNGLMHDHCHEWTHFVNRDELEQVPSLKSANINSWISNDTPELVQTPELSAFQQLLVITKKRPDRFFQAARNFITKMVPKLDQSNNLETLLELNSPTSPILMLLSGGIDPTTEIEEIAQRKSQQLEQVALDENNDAVENMLINAMKEGTWLLLKNCHLGTRWLNTIESHFDREIHADFRLWLTAESSPSFSTSVLRRSLKFCIEAPQGLGRAMQRISSSSWSDGHVTNETLQLSLLHAIIEERLNYRGIGWTKSYDFNASDLRVALRGSKHPHLMQRMICDVIYGARLDSQVDATLLKELTKLIVSSNGPAMPRLLDYPNSKITRKEAEIYINKLPVSQSGLPLGLAKNADQALAESQFETTMGTIVKLDRQQATNSDSWTKQVDYLRQIMSKNISQRTQDTLSKYTDNQTISSSDPVEAFFVGERRFGHKLHSLMMKSFKQLKQAMRSGLDVETKSLVSELLNDDIPGAWSRIYDYGATKPADYVKSVVRCLNYVFDQANLNHDTIDVASLFRPSALIISLEQKLWTGSPTQITMVKLASQGKVKLDGLYLAGADYDTKVKEARVETSTLVKLPPLGISFVAQDYSMTTIPLYNTLERQSNVTMATLSGLDMGAKNWVLNGTALFLKSI